MKKNLARILIRPPNRPSQAARALRSALASSRLSRSGEVARQYRYLLNWGNSNPITVSHNVTIINYPEAVANAVNKIKAFQIWAGTEGVNIPLTYVDKESVDSSGIILARTSITGSSGSGIIVVRPTAPIPDAPLYVEYIPKLVEYRVHVVNGKVIFVQQKKRDSEAEQDKDQKLIRSYNNGWVFCPLELDEVSEEVKDAAVHAVNGLGLHFGACDIVIHRDTAKPYILECNTAPGIVSPTLLAAYQEAFETWLI